MSAGRRGRDSGRYVLLGEAETVAVCVVRRGKVSGGCEFF